MRITACERAHLDAIQVLLNDAIQYSTALYDYHARTAESMQAWFDGKQNGDYPIVGAFDDVGHLLGFGSYGAFRAWPAYKYTLEHSVYVEHAHRGQGIGHRLLAELIACARRQDYHCLIGGIDAQNQASIALHRRAGFEHCATIRQVGFKFNRWLDLQFYQLILATPAQPRDG